MTETRAIWLAILCIPDLRGAATGVPSEQESDAQREARESELSRIAEVAGWLAGSTIGPERLIACGALNEVRAAPGQFGARYLKSVGETDARHRGTANPVVVAEDAYSQAFLEIFDARKELESKSSYVDIRSEFARRVRNAVRRDLGIAAKTISIAGDPAANDDGDRNALGAVWDAIRSYTNARVLDGLLPTDALNRASSGLPLETVEQLRHAQRALEEESSDDRRRFCFRLTILIRWTLREIAANELPGADDRQLHSREELIRERVAAAVERLKRALGG